VNEEDLEHATQYAEDRGMATGVVTSVEFSHATPAGFVAHNASRNNYAEIANEMIYESAADVIMGAGAPDYNNSGQKCFDEGVEVLCDEDAAYVGGLQTWDDLSDGTVAGADADGDGSPDDWTVIRTRQDFQAMAFGETPARVIGLPFVNQTLQQSRGGDDKADPYVVPLSETVPTLEEMTTAALNVLDDDPDGLFLMVEGGAVDWAGHANQSGRVVEEQIDFNNAVEAAVAWVNANSHWGETLLIVTGDHETGYLTGPGSDPTWEPLVNNGAGNLPGMEWHSGSHTNQLIPFFAKGSPHRMLKDYAKNGDLAGDDPLHGPYIDNTAIGQIVIYLLKN
jgi:alkaline phosphatase